MVWMVAADLKGPVIIVCTTVFGGIPAEIRDIRNPHPCHGRMPDCRFTLEIVRIVLFL